MSTPYIGEIRVVTFSFAPKGWALCNGQLLNIATNQALFSILGTTYGGNGINNFALPNLQGRTPVKFGNGFNLGEMGGEASHTLISQEMPFHTHPTVGSGLAADQSSPAGGLWAFTAANAYSATGNVTLHPASVSNAGGSQPHSNLSPFLVLNFVIALTGIYPPRN
jgi:microcystin-dependent protein